MSGVREFLAGSPIASRIALPSLVVVRDLKLSQADVKAIMGSGVLEPAGAEVCDLEVGGRRIARGRIVKRRGQCYFKVTEIETGGEA